LPALETLAERLLDFQYYGEATAKPFELKFTRGDPTAGIRERTFETTYLLRFSYYGDSQH
jgi:hypothetical protein